MDAEPRYALSENAAAKVIEREAIVINVVTGRYFDLEGAAAVAWVLLTAGAPLDAVVAAITERFAVERSRARADVEAFVEELLAAELLVPTAPDADADANGALDAFGEAPASPEPYERIALLMFDDLEDLLAFDPPLPARSLPDVPWSPA